MLEDMGRERMRAADTDREQVADQLRAALAEGRLELSEYDERVRDAYAAKTYGDLDRLLADLPTSVPVVPAATLPVQPQEDRITSRWVGHLWGPWVRVAGILTTIWLVTSMAGGDAESYWPAWVLAPWGIVLLLRTAAGLAGGEPLKHARAQEFRHRLREHKRERRALQARAVARGELPANPTKQQRRAFIAEAVARGDLPPRPRPPSEE